ncbi:retrovirus-related Pol polyprotein from transposon opus [Trichonephila clavipes]|nr:retrovirus-related Pol polyprotein from transposon opus [Trichonephila clavipes]
MDEESKPLTAFTTHNAVYQWKTMPFGLAGTSGTFQREMNRILKSHSEYAQAYMDDVIFSKTFEEHLVHLELVLAELEKLGFSVHCDASDYGVGCCLTQQDTEGIYRPLASASQIFNASQMNWASTEKEAWAVLYGLHKFDKWIYGAQVETISDPNPLKYLNQTTPKSPKLTRCALALQRWNHSITHRPVRTIGRDAAFVLQLHEYSKIHSSMELKREFPVLESPKSAITIQLTRGNENTRILRFEAPASLGT